MTRFFSYGHLGVLAQLSSLSDDQVSGDLAVSWPIRRDPPMMGRETRKQIFPLVHDQKTGICEGDAA